MSGGKKVLFICTAVFAHGGIQRFNRTLLAACAEINVGCDVISMMDDRATPSQFEAPPNVSVRMCSANKAQFSLR